MRKEAETHKAIIQYLSVVKKDLIVSSDPNGLKTTMGQAVQLKKMRLPPEGKHPDIFVFEPVGKYHGLFIEVKREGEELFKKKAFPPEFKSEHLQKQKEMHDRLRSKGYAGGFAIGFDEAKEMIDKYFKL